MHEKTFLTTEQHDALLDVEGLARLLNVSKTSVYRLVERRALPFHRLPAGLRFSMRDVEAYLAARRVEAMTAEPYGRPQD